ncbi:MAG: RHS repeat protein [Treponema sp.]|nr:RHS repeat protein [Candidatus Treponema equifaecale]
MKVFRMMLLGLVCSAAFAQPVYKEFDVNGKKISKWVTQDSYEEYDEKGNLIHGKYSDDSESFCEYDEKGKLILKKWINGEELLCEYDEKGHVIHEKFNTGSETWYEYDNKGNEIHKKVSDGTEIWTEYDEKGNPIHGIESDGYEWWSKFDKNGRCIYEKFNTGGETWNEYDKKGNLVLLKWSNGYESHYEYDKKGREIYHKDSDGNEVWTGYDKVGNKTYVNYGNEFEDFFENEYWSNGKLKKVTTYTVKNSNPPKDRIVQVNELNLSVPTSWTIQRYPSYVQLMSPKENDADNYLDNVMMQYWQKKTGTSFEENINALFSLSDAQIELKNFRTENEFYKYDFEVNGQKCSQITKFIEKNGYFYAVCGTSTVEEYKNWEDLFINILKSAK